MRRWIALLLVVAAFCAMALGSGHKRPIDTSEPDVNALKPKPLPSSTEELEQKGETAPGGPSFEQTVLYEGKDIVVSATGLTYESGVPTLGFLVENGSGRTLRAACDGLDVNGWYVGAPLELVCAPQCRTYGKLPVDLDPLAVCGITEIAQLDLAVTLTDAKTGSALPAGERVRILTDAALERAYTADKTGRLVYYAGGVEITVLGRDKRAGRSADPVLCIANTKDDPVRLELAAFYVNGAPFETALTAVVPGGRAAPAVIRVPRDELTRQKITPEQYVLRLEIRDEASGDLLDATDAIRIDYEDLRPLP